MSRCVLTAQCKKGVATPPANIAIKTGKKRNYDDSESYQTARIKWESLIYVFVCNSMDCIRELKFIYFAAYENLSSAFRVEEVSCDLRLSGGRIKYIYRKHLSMSHNCIGLTLGHIWGIYIVYYVGCAMVNNEHIQCLIVRCN